MIHPQRFALILLVSLMALLASSAAAQDPEEFAGGLSAGPLKLMADVSPGQVWEGSFRLVGHAPGAQATFDIEVFDLAQSLSGQKEPVEVGQGARSPARWIDVAPEVTLVASERREIPVTIRVPRDAYGAYSAIVVVKLRPEQPTAQLAAVLVPIVNIEILVLVRSSGPLEVTAEEIQLEPSAEGQPQWLSVDVRNTGVWVSEVAGDVLFYPEAGGFPARVALPFREDGRPYEIYPGQEIRLGCAPDVEIPPGRYTAVTRLDLGERRESRSQFALVVSGAESGRTSVDEASNRTELGIDLLIAEPTHQIRLPAGAERTVAIRLMNRGEERIALDVATQDVRLEEDGRWTYATAETRYPGLTIEVSADTVAVAPMSTATVKVTSRLEKDASLTSPVTEGVRFTSRDPGGAEGETRTVYDVGALLVIEPVGTGAASLEITGIELVRVAADKNPGSAIITIANTGEAIGEVRGRLVLKRETGEPIAEMAIGGDTWARVMPGGERRFRMPLPIVDEGVFVVGAELSRKDAPDEPLTAEVSFTSTAAIPEGLR